MKILSTTALKTTLDALAGPIATATGHRLDADYAPSTRIAARVAEGEVADGAIATEHGLHDLVAAGKIVPGSVVPVARSAIGVAVPRGAPRPDLSTVAGFVQALQTARTVATSQPAGGGQSGAHIDAVFRRLGLSEMLAPKLRYGAGGPAGLVGLFLTRGEADLAIQQMPELMAVDGIDVAGPLPDDVQSVTTFALGALTAGTWPEVVAALAELLRGTEAAKVLRAMGLSPV